MYYVYLIQSTVNNSFYVGFTKDLKSRIHQHLSGKVRSTKAFRPYILRYFEAYDKKDIALKREKQLKKQRIVKEQLIKRLTTAPSSSG